MSDPSATPRVLAWPEYRARWQEIDRRVAAGEYTPERAVQVARYSGLIAAEFVPNLPDEIRDVRAFAPLGHLELAGRLSNPEFLAR